VARSRNIKPGFFTNEVLGELPPLARILFAGMWCHADREGRLEDRMKRLKPQVLPYDECDIDALAQCLHDAGMVQRYVVDGKGYIQVLQFAKHQNPHVKEQASTIPAPCMPGANTSVAGLIPDSLNLIPSSLIPDSSLLDSLKPKPGKVKNTARGARLALNGLPPEWGAWARQERPDINPESVFDEFRDYWQAIAGSKGVKLDWFATWRNWCRRQNGSGKAGSSASAAREAERLIFGNNERVIE
jgi:hypothetical protein